jgi:hypothetical protein
MKLNNTDRMTLKVILGVLFLLTIISLMVPKRSMYQPKSISITSAGQGGSIFDLKRGVECLPGPDQTSGAYTIDERGVCGGQQFVSDAASYKISDGIGGVLI